MRHGTASFCLLTVVRVKGYSIHGNFSHPQLTFTGPKFQIHYTPPYRRGRGSCDFNEVAYGGVSFLSGGKNVKKMGQNDIPGVAARLVGIHTHTHTQNSPIPARGQ